MPEPQEGRLGPVLGTSSSAAKGFHGIASLRALKGIRRQSSSTCQPGALLAALWLLRQRLRCPHAAPQLTGTGWHWLALANGSLAAVEAGDMPLQQPPP